MMLDGQSAEELAVHPTNKRHGNDENTSKLRSPDLTMSVGEAVQHNVLYMRFASLPLLSASDLSLV